MFKFNRVFFIISNFILSFLIFVIIFFIRYKWFDFADVDKRDIDLEVLISLMIYSFIIVILNISFKIYELNKISQIKESILTNIFISLVSIGVIGGVYFFTKIDFARFVFFLGFLIIPFIISFYNKLSFSIILKRSQKGSILFFGEERNFRLLKELITQYNKWFFYEVEYLNMNVGKKELSDKLSNYKYVVVDTEQDISKDNFEVLNDYEIADGSIYSLIDIFGYLDQSLPAEIIKRRHFELFSSYRLDTFYAKVVKRVGDVFISLFLLVLTLPITLITVVLVKLTSKGKVFYTQKRVGLKGKEFYIYKFRSMVANAESGKPILAKENDMRVTAVGKVIRAFRIDELPQLFNILIGDMSFIGPRPERKELIEDIIKEVPLFKKRLLVKPGLSGWAQVKYTYVNSIEGMNKKLSYDLYYINNLNIFFDIKILLCTVETIIFRRGAI